MIVGAGVQAQEAESKINWMTMNEALEAQKETPKSFMLEWSK